MNLEVLVGLVKERVSFVKEIWDQTDYFFKAPETYDPEAVRKIWKEDAPLRLTELQSIIEKVDNFSPSVTEQAVKEWINDKGHNAGSIMNAVRLVIVGALRGPGIFDITGWIGKEETLKRISKGISTIGE